MKTVHVSCPVCGETAASPYAGGWDFEYDTVAETFTFVRCVACGALYLNPRPAISELCHLYPAAYAPYHFDGKAVTLRIRNRLEQHRVAALAKVLPATADVLDAGCGGPGFLEHVRRVGPPGWRLWGNDLADNVMADLARRGFQAVPGRFEDIALPDGSFDAIFFKQVLEHLEAPAAVMERAARLLRGGGRLIIETPNCDAWDARIFRRRYWGGYHFPRHWTLFTPPLLARLGKAVGLETESVRFMLSPSFWVQSAHHALKDHRFPSWFYGLFSHVNPVVMGMAAVLDGAQLWLTGKSSNMRMVLIKRR